MMRLPIASSHLYDFRQSEFDVKSLGIELAESIPEIARQIENGIISGFHSVQIEDDAKLQISLLAPQLLMSSYFAIPTATMNDLYGMAFACGYAITRTIDEIAKIEEDSKVALNVCLSSSQLPHEVFGLDISLANSIIDRGDLMISVNQSRDDDGNSFGDYKLVAKVDPKTKAYSLYCFWSRPEDLTHKDYLTNMVDVYSVAQANLPLADTPNSRNKVH